MLKDAREAGRPWVTPQACLDKHRCGQGRMAMQGLQSLHRAEAMTRSLARPNSRLQCQQINISNFRSHSWGLGGGSQCTNVGLPCSRPGYLRGGLGNQAVKRPDQELGFRRPRFLTKIMRQTPTYVEISLAPRLAAVHGDPPQVAVHYPGFSVRS